MTTAQERIVSVAIEHGWTRRRGTVSPTGGAGWVEYRRDTRRVWVSFSATGQVVDAVYQPGQTTVALSAPDRAATVVELLSLPSWHY